MPTRASLEAENQALRERVGHQDVRIRQLEEMLRAYRHEQFGPSSEQTSPDQRRLFAELEDEDLDEAQIAPATPVRSHSRRSRGRPRLGDHLPRVEVVHDLDEADKVCDAHGCALERIGEETSEQLDYIPATVQVIRHIRPTYTCPACEGYVKTAPLPPQPIPKSVATPGLLAWITVSKYVDALPLYRQTVIFERLGIALDRTTLAHWMIACGELVQPLINLLGDHVRQQRVVHLDETSVQVLDEPGRPPQTKSYMWVSAAGPPGARAVLFHYAPSRSARVASELLADYDGTVMVDGYEGYEAACRANGITRLGCWAHARRRFVQAQRQQPKGKTGKADQALVLINGLYRIERAMKDASPDDRYAARRQQAVPLLEKLRAWLDKAVVHTAPKTSLGKALHYLDGQWPRLVRYVEDGTYPIDNNAAENAIRPFVVGRKNWLFSQSTRGVQASANLYSLIETAKANHIDPFAYLTEVFTELPKAKTVDAIAALLPGNLKNGV